MTAEPPLMTAPVLLRDREVAQMLNVSKSKAYLLMVSGEVPGVMRLGRCLRVHRPTLEKWLAERANIGGAL